MVYLLATKRRVGTQAILTDNATNQQRFVNLKSVFAQYDLYRLFAEPAESTSDISWYTDWPVDTTKPVLTLGELSQHDPAHASEVKGKVASLMDAFYREAEKYRSNGQSYERLQHILTDSFEIPEAETNVWILTDTTGQERYVLTQWGHLRDEYNPRRGLINSWERVMRKDITLKTTWADNRQPASGQTLTFTDTSGNRIGQFTTDSAGQGQLTNVLSNVPLSYYQNRLDGLDINQGKLLIDEREEYDIALVRFGELTVRTKPGTAVTFAYDDKRETYTADPQGVIRLPNLRGGVGVRAFETADGKELNEQSFRFDPEEPTVSFVVANVAPAPSLPLGDITVELHKRRQFDAPIAGADVAFQVAGRTETRRTDSAGICSLEAVPVGEVSVKVMHQGKSYSGVFSRSAEFDQYKLWVKPSRGKAWLWWLLGILLLLILLCYWHWLPICPYCCEQEESVKRAVRGREEPVVDSVVTTDTVHVRERVLHRGDITLTLEWETADDLDLYLNTPDGASIHFGETNKVYRSNSNNMTGHLEIDANVNEDILMDHPVEHIYCNNPIPGTYSVFVNLYKSRTNASEPLPFTVKIQVGDSLSVFNGNRADFSGTGSSADKLLVKEITYP